MLRIAHAVGYWLLSLWLIFVSILAVDELIDIHSDPSDYQQIYSSFVIYKLTIWLYLVLTATGVVAQISRLRQQRLSLIALASAAAVAATQTAIVFFDFNRSCCT